MSGGRPGAAAAIGALWSRPGAGAAWGADQAQQAVAGAPGAAPARSPTERTEAHLAQPAMARSPADRAQEHKPQQVTEGAAASPPPSPPVVAELLCSAMIVFLVFCVYRWWKQDQIYAMREKEREMDLERVRSATLPVVGARMRRTNSGGGNSGSPWEADASFTRAPSGASLRRAYSSAVLQASEARASRQEKQERRYARVEQLMGLVESPVAAGGGTGGSCPDWELSNSDSFLYSSESNIEGGSDGMLPPSWNRTGAQGAGTVTPTRVSSASRYTAQLLKRRGSISGAGSISPVARTPSLSSPISRTSSGDLGRRASPGGPAFQRRPSAAIASPPSPVRMAERVREPPVQ